MVSQKLPQVKFLGQARLHKRGHDSQINDNERSRGPTDVVHPLLRLIDVRRGKHKAEMITAIYNGRRLARHIL